MAFSVPPVDSISKYYAVVVVRLLVRFSRDDSEKKRWFLLQSVKAQKVDSSEIEEEEDKEEQTFRLYAGALVLLLRVMSLVFVARTAKSLATPARDDDGF